MDFRTISWFHFEWFK